MTFEQILRVIELSLTFIGVLLVIFGWIIPYKQSIQIHSRQQDFEQSLLERKWEKEHIDLQISKLYGPIAELTRESNIIFHQVMNQIGRSYVFKMVYKPSDDSYTWGKLADLPEKEQKIWVHFIENYSLPIQARVLEIIQENQHLIYQSKVPECFNTYMNYVLGWRLLHEQMKNGVPNNYQYYYDYNYPKEFNDYIESTLATLLTRQTELIWHIEKNADSSRLQV
jgi:hypothetical protein